MENAYHFCTLRVVGLGVSTWRESLRDTSFLSSPQQRRNPVILQQDDAQPHRAIVTRDFFGERNGIDVLPWPAVSPDMN